VYRLWDDDDLRELFASHADEGWVCSLVCGQEGSEITWAVRLQNNTSRQLLSASLSDVVVSDLVTVVAQSLDDYNAANPDAKIEEGS
jgi:hypothetical protein